MNKIKKKFLCDKSEFYNFLKTSSLSKKNISLEIISQRYYINNSKFEFIVRTSYNSNSKSNKYKTYFTFKSKNIYTGKEYKVSFTSIILWFIFSNYSIVKNNIISQRYTFTYNSITYTVDDFISPSNLTLCEVKLDTKHQPVPQLPFFIEEVTHNLNYYNSNIAKTISTLL